jgi:hypothetical protein
MKSIHGYWAEVAHRLARILGTSHPQPVDTHPLLVDLETINLLKPPKMLQQVAAACMKQKNCTIILKMSAGKAKKLIKKSAFSTFHLRTSPFALEMFGIERLSRMSTMTRSTPRE